MNIVMEKKYYTNFCFQNYLPSEIHCTHVYLGELSDIQLAQVLTKIQYYFTLIVLKKTMMPFYTREFFGPDNDIPVLTLSSSETDLHLSLRNELLHIASDSYSTYRPHVTTKLESFEGVLDRYSLVQKEGSIITEVYRVQAQ
jgi:hypothetical protein